LSFGLFGALLQRSSAIDEFQQRFSCPRLRLRQLLRLEPILLLVGCKCTTSVNTRFRLESLLLPYRLWVGCIRWCFAKSTRVFTRSRAPNSRVLWVQHTSVSPDSKTVIVVGDNADGLLADSQSGKVKSSQARHLFVCLFVDQVRSLKRGRMCLFL
jgi:hypothetical protein